MQGCRYKSVSLFIIKTNSSYSHSSSPTPSILSCSSSSEVWRMPLTALVNIFSLSWGPNVPWLRPTSDLTVCWLLLAADRAGISSGWRLTQRALLSSPASHSAPVRAGCQRTRVGGNKSSWKWEVFTRGTLNETGSMLVGVSL